MSTNDAEIRSSFRGNLAQLRELVLRLATFVEDMLSKSMQALMTQDRELAEEVRISDDVPDQLDFDIEQLSIQLLALQQPMARDLREISASMRIATDLERFGDYSRDIAKVARRLADKPYYWPLEDIPVMANRVGEMIRLAIKAFVDRDLELALKVIDMDAEVDRLWKLLRDQLMEHMRHDPEHVYQATFLLLVVRYLERMGDHTVNVAERVEYLETGQLTLHR